MSPPSPAVDPLFIAFQDALAGRYSLDRELGRGGMGIVYLAREVHLDRPVAIKLLRPERAADPTQRERFLLEARRAARLSHPNIIPIHSVDDMGGFAFYVMAYIDGETLARRVKTRGPLSTADGTRIVSEVAWALSHAHAQGMVHRNVKPANILLETAGGRALVTDFVIAAPVTAVAGTALVGTPEFVSPEHALGRELDPRSDLYALGAAAFFVFSGLPPSEAETATETAPSQALTAIAIPRKVALLVERCLSEDPDRRPANAESVAEQLAVSIEQRREIPAALRAFVKRHAHLNETALIYPVGVAGVSIGVAALAGWLGVSRSLGTELGFATYAVGMIGGPLAYLAHGARKLSLLGFGHRDIAPAFKAHIEDTEEEYAVEQRKGPSIVERFLGVTAKAALAIGSVSLVAVVATNVLLRPDFNALRLLPAWWWRLPNIAFLSLGTSLVTYVGRMTLLQRRKDVDSAFLARLWSGRIGKLAFSIARKLLGGRAITSISTHRATELSLGLAAEQLFDSLPRATREALGDLPDLLRRLQDDAQRLRRVHDDLQEALTAAGDDATTDAYQPVRADRDVLRAKLTAAVGALETIRLNLLRLHAGSGNIEGFTTHLALAADMSHEIERLLTAQQEVERDLSFPRDIAATPA